MNMQSRERRWGPRHNTADMKLGRPASQLLWAAEGRRGESGDAGDGQGKAGGDRVAWRKRGALVMGMASGEGGGGGV